MATVDTLSPAAGIGCVGLDAVKRRFGLPADDSTADAELGELITTASEICRAVIGREPWRQTYEETITGPGEVDLFTHHWPLEGVDAVTMDGQAIDLGEVRVYRCKLRRLGGVWPRGAEITVTYRAGWLVPGQVTTWQTETSVARGLFVPAGGLWAECTTAGVTSDDLPAWPSTPGEVVADGTVRWTVRHAHQADAVLRACALGLVVLLDAGYLEVEPGIASESDCDSTVSYSTRSRNTEHAAVNNRVQALLPRYR